MDFSVTVILIIKKNTDSFCMKNSPKIDIKPEGGRINNLILINHPGLSDTSQLICEKRTR